MVEEKRAGTILVFVQEGVDITGIGRPFSMRDSLVLLHKLFAQGLLLMIVQSMTVSLLAASCVGFIERQFRWKDMVAISDLVAN